MTGFMYFQHYQVHTASGDIVASSRGNQKFGLTLRCLKSPCCASNREIRNGSTWWFGWDFHDDWLLNFNVTKDLGLVAPLPYINICKDSVKQSPLRPRDLRPNISTKSMCETVIIIPTTSSTSLKTSKSSQVRNHPRPEAAAAWSAGEVLLEVTKSMVLVGWNLQGGKCGVFVVVIWKIPFR